MCMPHPFPKAKHFPDYSLESELPNLDTIEAMMGWWPVRKDLYMKTNQQFFGILYCQTNME